MGRPPPPCPPVLLVLPGGTAAVPALAVAAAAAFLAAAAASIFAPAAVLVAPAGWRAAAAPLLVSLPLSFCQWRCKDAERRKSDEVLVIADRNSYTGLLVVVLAREIKVQIL